MIRLPDANSRLHKLIAELETKPFQYGVNDCAIFGGRVLESLTGEDHYSMFVGKYKTKTGGFRAFKKATGFNSHIAWIESKLEEIPVSMGSSGDLAFFETNEGFGVAVMAGPVAIAVSENGLVRLDLDTLSHCFKIGV